MRKNEKEKLPSVEEARAYFGIPADKVIRLTVDEAAKLPNLLGPLCSVSLELKGWYARQSGGVTTFYERA